MIPPRRGDENGSETHSLASSGHPQAELYYSPLSLPTFPQPVLLGGPLLGSQWRGTLVPALGDFTV